LKVKKNLLKKKAKSFYFASIFLSRDCFKNCSQLYNFCRVVDDIADNNYKNKKFLLKNIYNSINNPVSFKSKYISEIKPLIKLRIINKACLKELIHGVMLDTKKKISILDKSELINYSYYVAGTVGIMMAKILNAQNKYAYRYAVDLGIAMQLTNIMRDIIEDASMDRVYYPKAWLKLTSKNILENNANTIKNINKATEKLFELSEK
jgi:phytoene synthase